MTENTEPRPPIWHPVWRYRAWKVRHMVGEWWIDAWILSEKNWRS